MNLPLTNILQRDLPSLAREKDRIDSVSSPSKSIDPAVVQSRIRDIYQSWSGLLQIEDFTDKYPNVMPEMLSMIQCCIADMPNAIHGSGRYVNMTWERRKWEVENLAMCCQRILQSK